jgi:hypothetical protein
MNPTLQRLLVLLAGLTLTTAAFAAPSLVVPPIPSAKGITAPIASGFDAHLRGVAAKKAKLISPKMTKAALSGGDGNCGTDACSEKLAKATRARFVLSASVSNSDEIFTVSLSLYDAVLKKRTKTSEICELCAVEEVDGSIAKAFAGLGTALAAKAPPAAPAMVSVAIKSTPTGASISIDQKAIGKTPVTTKVKPGEHSLEVTMAGFITDTRTIAAVDKPVTLALTLVADPDTAAIEDPELPATLAPVPAPAVATIPEIQQHTGAVVGMGIGGAILAGVGTWLVVLDGDITCDDGRSRTECPTVYNTKAVGLPAVGLGAGLIGAAIAVAILDGSNSAMPVPAVSPSAEGGAVFHIGGTF